MGQRATAALTYAQQLAATFALATDPAFTYKVQLKAGSSDEVFWETKENGTTVIHDDAPQTSSWRRFKAWFGGLLPVEDML